MVHFSRSESILGFGDFLSGNDVEFQALFEGFDATKWLQIVDVCAAFVAF